MSDDGIDSSANLEFEWDESDFVSQNDAIENYDEPPQKKQKLVLNSPTQEHIPTPDDQIYTYEDEDEFEQFEDFPDVNKGDGQEYLGEAGADGCDEDILEVTEGSPSPDKSLSRTQVGIWEKFGQLKPDRRIPGPVGTLLMKRKLTEHEPGANHPVLMSSPRKPLRPGSNPVVNIVEHHQGVEEWEDSFQFRKPAWLAMLKAERLPPWTDPGTAKLLEYNIAHIFQGGFSSKIPRLVCLISAMNLDTEIVKVTLHDPSASIEATMGKNVLNDNKQLESKFVVGSVLVLQNNQFLLIITADNIKEVISSQVKWPEGMEDIKIDFDLKSTYAQSCVFPNAPENRKRPNVPQKKDKTEKRPLAFPEFPPGFLTSPILSPSIRSTAASRPMYGGGRGGRGGRGGKYAPKSYNTPGNSNSNSRSTASSANSNTANNATQNNYNNDNHGNASQLQQQQRLPKQRVPPRSGNDQQHRQSQQGRSADAGPVDWSGEQSFLTMKVNNNNNSATGHAMQSNATNPNRQNAINSIAPSSAIPRSPTSPLQSTSLTPISSQSLPSANVPKPSSSNKFQHPFHSQSSQQPSHAPPQASLSLPAQQQQPQGANAPFRPPSPRVPKLLTPLHGNVNIANNVISSSNNNATNNNSSNNGSATMQPQPSLSPVQLNSRNQAMNVNPMSPVQSLINPQHSLQGYNVRGGGVSVGVSSSDGNQSNANEGQQPPVSPNPYSWKRIQPPLNRIT